MSGAIDTDDFSTRLRAKAIRPSSRELLISNLQGTGQEKDLTVAPICQGYARIRHFTRRTSGRLASQPFACRTGSASPRTARAGQYQSGALSKRRM